MRNGKSVGSAMCTWSSYRGAHSRVWGVEKVGPTSWPSRATEALAMPRGLPCRPPHRTRQRCVWSIPQPPINSTMLSTSHSPLSKGHKCKDFYFYFWKIGQRS